MRLRSNNCGQKTALVALLYGPVLMLWSAVLLPVVLLARHVYRVRLG